MARRWRAIGIFVLLAASLSGLVAIAQGNLDVGAESYGDGGYVASAGGDGAPQAVLAEESFMSSSPGMSTGNVISCKRFVVPALSRFQGFKKMAHARRLNLSAPFTVSKIESCIHENKTSNLCQCPKEMWKALDNKWSRSMSPFETILVDVRSDRKASIRDAAVSVSVKDEFCAYRLFFFALGIALLISAPIVSEWVPFYYGSGMTLGIILVVIIILFQLMKMLPFGRKSSIYVLLYGSLVGFGALIVRQISIMLTPLLVELGLGEDMVKPMAILSLLGIFTLGAYLGYWGVRKFILSEGRVDSGTAEFVKWAIRIFGITMLLQSSADPVFSLFALLIGILVSLVPFKGMGSSFDISWPFSRGEDNSAFNAWRYRKYQEKMLRKKRAASPYGAPSSSYQSPVTLSGKRVFVSPPASVKLTPDQVYYSTYHRTPERRKLSRAEREALGVEVTQSCVKELLSSPEFTEWAAENADRIAVLPVDHREERSDDEIEMTASMSV